MQRAAEAGSGGCRNIGCHHPARARPAPHLLAILAAVWVVAAETRSYAQDAAPDRFAPAQATTPYADARLPFGAPARITIRYPVENMAARQRATDLARGLSEQGLDVADPVASPGRIASSTVSYFYAEDRLGAEIAARARGPACTPAPPRPPPGAPLPRPGALELAVAGP